MFLGKWLYYPTDTPHVLLQKCIREKSIFLKMIKSQIFEQGSLSCSSPPDCHLFCCEMHLSIFSQTRCKTSLSCCPEAPVLSYEVGADQCPRVRTCHIYPCVNSISRCPGKLHLLLFFPSSLFLRFWFAKASKVVCVNEGATVCLGKLGQDAAKKKCWA